MSPKDWEHELVNAYCTYRWQQLLEPLCATFQGWKAGTLSHEEVDRALDEAYKQKCVLNNLFCQRVDRVWNLIQWWDRDWFEGWVEEHRPPADVELAPPSE